MLRSEALTLGFGSRAVLTEASVSVAPGDRIALIGANGAGKSTLLRGLCGAQRPIAGTVSWLGEDLAQLNERAIAQRITFVPQREMDVFDFPVYDYVMQGRLPYARGSFESQEDHAAVNRALDRMHVQDFAWRSVMELSGGERQRALFARALAQDTPLMLLDEVMLNLDVSATFHLGAELKALAEEGKAWVCAVHDLDWAAQFANQAWVIHDGRISFQGDLHTPAAQAAIETALGIQVLKTEVAGATRWVTIPPQRLSSR